MTLRRRLVSVPALFLLAVGLTALAPIWLPLTALADLVRGRTRLPTTRLLSFGVCWAWLEVCGVVGAFGLWCIGRAKHHPAQYALQRWWAARLMGALKATTGIAIEAAEASALSPGPTIMLCRHASLADSLVSAWVITSVAGMNPRYVLKRELLVDPCLDIVGNRLPNHFLDRGADDSSAELAALRDLASGLHDDQVAVIFPEGTRAAAHKRERALTRIAERDPERAAKLAALRHLLPPRPSGAAALLDGAPTADVVVAWHVGFDGLDTFGGILRHIARRPRPVQFHARRVAREEIPSGEGFTAWLDDQWLLADDAVHQLLEGS
ncbi:MAG TPA: 1-acyl-sn-glycerol-3-phosphate acyltransferase [Ilumatobacteraceae bacterium]|nr:1-acyl-sn-glycerol-3-phosphate acyltransferase [Ilumatobacteraceae bacterium]